MASIKETKSDRDWQAQSDLRTVSESCEIRKDKARWKAVVAEAKKQKQALEELEDVSDNSYKSWKDKQDKE